MIPVTIVSLTAKGQALSERLDSLLPEAKHLHRPPRFGETVRTCFRSGQRLILICATGIAVRTLAPTLNSKTEDPAVLVLDEHGRFVVPLISGHEGGGNAWGREVADFLQATCVVTGARSFMRPVLVAGVGCIRGCSRQVLEALLLETLDRRSADTSDLAAIASIDLKRDEVGLLALADKLDVPCTFYSANELGQYHDRLTERSDVVYRETGCYGVAEAAAIAHAERLSKGPAELWVSKRKTAEATVALAMGYQERE